MFVSPSKKKELLRKAVYLNLLRRMLWVDYFVNFATGSSENDLLKNRQFIFLIALNCLPLNKVVVRYLNKI